MEMDKANSKKCGNGLGDGNKGPGIKWNPGSVGGYSRGLENKFKGNVEDHNRKGAGAKQ